MVADLLHINNLTIGYRQGKEEKRLLDNLNLSVSSGNLIALIGSNGIGKSTLLRTICNLQPALFGSITIDGVLWTRMDSAQMAQKISLVTTEMHRSVRLTVFDVVALGRFPYLNWFGTLNSGDNTIVKEAVNAVGMDSFLDREISSLSDGEFQRVMIARALAQDTPIIILDEPTAFLDLPNKYAIVELLWKLTRKKNKLVIFTTHDLNVAMQFSDFFWVLANNTITAAPPEDLIISNTLEHLFENRKVFFHRETGQFKLHKKHFNEIEIQGLEDYMQITWMALDRLGFEVHCNKSCTVSVKIEEYENKVCWTVNDGCNIYFCYSINEMQNVLRKSLVM